MPNNPSMVTKQAIELGTISFVQERYRELDIAGDPAELFRQAAHLRERIERHRSRATTAISVGFLILAVGFGVLAFGLRPFTLDLVSFAIIAALVAAGWWLLDFGFRSEQRARYGRHGANQPRYEIESSDIFARVFEPVERGACQLALLSPSGTSTSFTPVSLLPVELYVIKNGFADAWLPAQVLYEPIEIGGDEKRVTAPDPNYVVIRWLERLKEPRSPSGQWTKYYLWNLEPALAEALFDRAAEIYPDKPIERIKARIAVTMICSHFQKCRKQGRRPKSHTMLEKMFGELLVDEAAWRLAANEITFRQSQLLSRVNISGSVKSLDPADPKALLSAQPGSWFYKLLSGTNKTILPHIRAEALKDQPDLPLFMDD